MTDSSFYEHFAKTIFRSCEQSYTDADSKSAQIYKYRAFQVPPTQERPMTLADCDSDGRQIAPSRAHRAPWPGDTRYRLVYVSSVTLCVSIQSPALRGSDLSAALRAVIQQALSAKSGGRNCSRQKLARSGVGRSANKSVAKGSNRTSPGHSPPLSGVLHDARALAQMILDPL